MQVIHRKSRLAGSYYAAGRPELWGVSHIYPGSAYNWADGIGMSDWNAFTGSEMYRQGLAAGLTDIGGKLYGFDEEGRLLKEPAVYRNGLWGYYKELETQIDYQSENRIYYDENGNPELINGGKDFLRTLATFEVERVFVAFGQQNGDPLKKHIEQAISLEEWRKIYEGMSREEIARELDGRGVFGSQSGGPANRYVIEPKTGNVIDMRHFIIIGKAGETVGNMVELYQTIRGWDSGGDPQDYYSNELGYRFYILHREPIIYGPNPQVVGYKYVFPDGFANSVYHFLKN